MSVRIVSAENGLDEAAARLRRGELVAFPTETVYGLGANALDTEAVARIYTAKGRPATNPLIVHVADVPDIARVVAQWNETAERLAARFLPGPLTLVLPRRDTVPDRVSAGGPTVAVRIPAHPVARELIRRAGVPVAAPSANRSEEVSPTTAVHVFESLSPYVDDLLILDGGPCTVGIESTVVDVTVNPPRILRPGQITEEQLWKALGYSFPPVVTPVEPGERAEPEEATVARSPGQMARHYAPHTPLLLIKDDELPHSLDDGDILLTHQPAHQPMAQDRQANVLLLPPDAAGYARELYAALRRADAGNHSRILVADPPGTPEWAAIRDRLRRAASTSH
ncbi:MAG: L-threonylcarbamoyladenylate synthase [Armatimonadaceae bacterium]